MLIKPSSNIYLRCESVDHKFIAEQNGTQGGTPSSRMKMEIFLQYIGDAGFEIGVANNLRADHPTVCKTYPTVLESIVSKVQDWIKFPSIIAKIKIA